jgi:APA family basic amino acid/polyamine antiporter
MRAAMGEHGALWIAIGIAISTLGFLSQGILTAPRVYYAMASDGLFFKTIGRLSPRSGAPVAAIVLQGILATIIALSGKYEQILNYEISVDFISFAFTAGAIFVFRRRIMEPGYRHPGHPYTTATFILACVGIVASTVLATPMTSLIGFGILLTGVPVYLYWKRK